MEQPRSFKMEGTRAKMNYLGDGTQQTARCKNENKLKPILYHIQNWILNELKM